MKRRATKRNDVERVLKSRHVKKDKKLFAYIMKKHKMLKDSELADFLCTTPSIISQIRNDKAGFSHRLILVTYDKTDLSIEDIRQMAREDYDG